jgi:hypothetical protein
MRKSVGVVFMAGLLAGTLDITAAFIQFGLRGVSPGRILQGVASGLLGAHSYQGGSRTVVLGGLLHFVIAFSAAGAYYAVSRRVSFLTNRPIVAGLLYGPIVYAFMNGVVVPLSAKFPKGAVTAGDVVTGMITLACLAGLPISLVVWRFSRPHLHSLVTADSHTA